MREPFSWTKESKMHSRRISQSSETLTITNNTEEPIGLRLSADIFAAASGNISPGTVATSVTYNVGIGMQDSDTLTSPTVEHFHSERMVSLSPGDSVSVTTTVTSSVFDYVFDVTATAEDGRPMVRSGADTYEFTA
jgi:hypothetical protein